MKSRKAFWASRQVYGLKAVSYCLQVFVPILISRNDVRQARVPVPAFLAGIIIVYGEDGGQPGVFQPVDGGLFGSTGNADIICRNCMDSPLYFMQFVEADCINCGFADVSCRSIPGSPEPPEAVMPAVRDDPVERPAICISAAELCKIPFQIYEYNIIFIFFLV